MNAFTVAVGGNPRPARSRATALARCCARTGSCSLDKRKILRISHGWERSSTKRPTREPPIEFQPSFVSDDSLIPRATCGTAAAPGAPLLHPTITARRSSCIQPVASYAVLLGAIAGVG
jgi:hypothetical protein